VAGRPFVGLAPKSGGTGRPFVGLGPKAKTGKGHHGILGAVENLGADVKDAAVGIGPGIVHLATDPVGSVKNIGKSYSTTYGPLAHGDISKFLHNLYEHPLGPITDAFTIATLGAGAASKAGLIAEAAHGYDLASPAVKAGQSGKVLTKPIVGTEVSRRLKLGLQKAYDRAPDHTPYIGSVHRYARELDRLPRRDALRVRNSPEARAYTKATKNLTNEEFAALHLIGRGVHPLDYLSFLRKQNGHVEPAMLKVLENPEVSQLVDHPTPNLAKAVSSAKALSELDAKVKVERGLLDPANAAARISKHETTVYGEAKGRAKFYVPDVLPGNRYSNLDIQRMGGGKGVPRVPGSAKENKGILFKTGQLALHPDVLGPEFLNTLKYGLHQDIHSELMQSAVRSTRQPHPDWVAVRKSSSQKIPKTAQNAARTRDQLSELAGAEYQPDKFHIEPGQSLDDAEQIHGEYLWVPRQLADHLAGEFTRSSGAIRKFIEKPLQTWRALVLGLRVGFLVNNFVGNHLLYAIHAAGPDGLKAYLNAVKRVHGESMVKRLITDHQIPEALRERFMDEFFPEQSHAATFGETQKPGPVLGKRLQGKKGRKLKRATAGLLPATQAASETVLRRALVEKLIRTSPEFKKVYNAMPRQTRSFETAAHRLLKSQGGDAFQARISEQVNNALGDYLHMGALGKAARDVLPFFSWYKAIVRITAHLALDNPLRLQIIEKIGQLGVEWNEQQLGPLPDYLKGIVVLGKGDNPLVASSSGVNPFATIGQVTDAGGLIYGKPGTAGRAFSELGPNPFLLSAIEQLSGKDLFSGRDLKGNQGLALVGPNIATELPQVQVAKAIAGHGRKSKLYGKQSGAESLLQFLGAPLKNLDKSQIKRP
jgi:hypothetical protein